MLVVLAGLGAFLYLASPRARRGDRSRPEFAVQEFVADVGAGEDTVLEDFGVAEPEGSFAANSRSRRAGPGAHPCRGRTAPRSPGASLTRRAELLFDRTVTTQKRTRPGTPPGGSPHRRPSCCRRRDPRGAKRGARRPWRSCSDRCRTGALRHCQRLGVGSSPAPLCDRSRGCGGRRRPSRGRSGEAVAGSRDRRRGRQSCDDAE